MTHAVLDRIASDERGAIGRWMEWLRIPSVSTDPKHAGDCRRAAQWCLDRLTECGFSGRLVEAGEIGPDGKGSGHPIVMATVEGRGANGKAAYAGPRVLFYGHYDVQPADPLDLWESPAFEPVLKPASGEVGERVVARGAVDDKGQVMTFLEACRARHAVEGHPTGGVPMTVVIEGEEESGSVNLEAFVRAHSAELKRCGVCLISDTGMLDRDVPAITYGVRGLAYTQVTLHAADQDLHSGLWGGKCPNPNAELCKVLAQLWDKDRRITIPGFYDKVRALTEAERAAWRGLGHDATAALAKIGLGPEGDVGEAGFTPLEREWGRPTAEINGIWGGYIGPGAKTVIPAKASAKVSFRLVADQDPGEVAAMFFAWLRERTPKGCRWELEDLHGGPGVTTPTDSVAMRAATRALERAGGKKPALIKSGGSIPVAGMLKATLGLDTIFMGFGLDDDRVHSPNEKFELSCFRLGCRAHALLVEELMHELAASAGASAGRGA